MASVSDLLGAGNLEALDLASNDPEAEKDEVRPNFAITCSRLRVAEVLEFVRRKPNSGKRLSASLSSEMVC